MSKLSNFIISELNKHNILYDTAVVHLYCDSSANCTKCVEYYFQDNDITNNVFLYECTQRLLNKMYIVYFNKTNDGSILKLLQSEDRENIMLGIQIMLTALNLNDD